MSPSSSIISFATHPQPSSSSSPPYRSALSPTYSCDSDLIEYETPHSTHSSFNRMAENEDSKLLLSTMSQPQFDSPRSRVSQSFPSSSGFHHHKARVMSISTSLNQIKASAAPRRRFPFRVFTLFLGTVALVIVVVSNRRRGGASIQGLSLLRGHHGVMVPQNARGKPMVDFEVYELPEEWQCNPFKEYGRLQVDVLKNTSNIWIPYDEECPPSRLMEGVLHRLTTMRAGPPSGRRKKPLRAADSSRPMSKEDLLDEEPYPWLVNATLLMHGDSMERLHNNDWCDFMGGEKINVTPEHPLSPATVRKEMPTILGPDGLETAASKEAKVQRIALEDYWEQSRKNSWFYTRPWVCDLRDYNATVINTFAWGLLDDMEAIYTTEEFFHSPSTYLERFEKITLPLLQNIATQMSRPQVLQPTLIELSAGFWDLRAMTEQDFILQGIPRPYPMDSDLAFGPIGKAREKQWARNVRQAVEHIARAFPGKNGVRDGPPILVRSLHNPKRNNYTPYTRAFALDHLIRRTVHDLRVQSLASHPSLLDTVKIQLKRTWKIHTLYGADEQDETNSEDVDYGFDERLRIDEIGPLLRAQEDHFKDFLHPSPIPGSYVWGDIMLYEMKRAVARVGRTFA